MSDIAKELGAELIRRLRDGTLKNGTGTELVRKALADTEREQRETEVRRIAGQMPYLARLSGDTFLRELNRLAAECRVEQFFNGDGDGI